MQEQHHTHLGTEPSHYATSLAIALVVSAVFLLAATGICIWLLTKPAGSTLLQQQIGDGSNAVKKVSFVTPPDLPSTYAKREQNTQTAQTAYYDDAGSSCGITTNVWPATQPPAKLKQSVLDTVKTGEAYGISVTNSSDAADYKIKDADGKHAYTFPSLQLEQKVDVQNIPFQSQRTIIAYKQFGSSVATIASTCRTDSWDAKKDQLHYLVSTFAVKTEK